MNEIIVHVLLSADIRKLYFQAGVENKPTVFLFTDTQVVDESFMEDINNILSSGEVPNLYKPDEFEEVMIISIDLTIGFYLCKVISIVKPFIH